MEAIKRIEKEQLKRGIPVFRPGDTLRVYCRITEGDKERVQLFEGVCIRRRRGGTGASFTVRKNSFGVGVERVFPLHSPAIDRIEVASKGDVGRSRLYYLRELSGKAARIEGRWTAEEVAEVADETAGEPSADEAAGAS
jgi:large subunit ribosomal protein L19